MHRWGTTTRVHELIYQPTYLSGDFESGLLDDSVGRSSSSSSSSSSVSCSPLVCNGLLMIDVNDRC